MVFIRVSGCQLHIFKQEDIQQNIILFRQYNYYDFIYNRQEDCFALPINSKLLAAFSNVFADTAA